MKLFVLLSVLFSLCSSAFAQRECPSRPFTHPQWQPASIAATGTGPANNGALQVIRIPVVVHIVYNTSRENISDAQIQSQIDVLNRDYGKTNADTVGIPGYYRGLAANCGLQFVLANTDMDGNATTGITRKHTNLSSFQVDDAIKFTARGGDDAWDRDRYLNIWVGNLTGGILGYSSIPGTAKPTDGVAILYTAFGSMGTATAPFNLGRTATHEIGHWLNLIHIWGDSDCGDDEVDDTPQQQGATRGNPSGKIFSCGNTPDGNLYMDFMDFTDDVGMHMFTYGQRNRMRTLFSEGGFREPLLNSNALSGSPVNIGEPASPLPPSGPVDPVVLQLYPNPAVNTVSIDLSGKSYSGSLLEIYNQLGQRVRSTIITTTPFQCNIADLPAGLYFIRLNGSGVKPARLVKL